MRRMYSQTELAELVKNVFLADVESGEIDLDSIIAEKLDEIDWSDIDFKPKTVAQLEANWSADITSFPSNSGCTATPIFCRAQQLNQEFHIVMLGKLHNNTASDISLYGLTAIEINLPEAIADKIYDVAGNKVSGTPGSYTRIDVAFASVFKEGALGADMSKFQQCVMSVLNSSVANQIILNFNSGSSMTLKAGEDTYFESRIALDLI